MTMRPRPIDDSPIVPVRSSLRPSTFRIFDARARELGVDIGVLLSRLADRAVTPKPRRRAAAKPLTATRSAVDEVDRRIVELNAQRLSDRQIGERVGLHQTAVSRRRRLMGIPSPGRWPQS